MANNNNANDGTKQQWQQDGGNWKWGVFYFNKKDKRIFPPKRSGLGWTINFANPLSILVFLAVLTAVYYISRYLNSK